MPLSKERKAEYFDKMKSLLGEYKKCFVVDVDNVSSKQIQDTRAALRSKAEILCGKNTMMRKIIKEYSSESGNDNVAALENLCKGNVGFIFTNGDLAEIKSIVEANVRPAPARIGAIAPSDVIIQPGPTGCDPGQTAFFQTLQIPTKITKGQIEMTGITHLIHEGEKVGASQAALLVKLSICPFTYGFVLKHVYDNGTIFAAKVLDITPEVLAAKFGEALKAIASLSLAANFPTTASVPHSIANAFKSCLAITIGLPTFTFEKAAAFKALCPLPAAE
jgi:large subunit ribosomal protein LP0